MRSAKRWTLSAILAAGDVLFFDEDGDKGEEDGDKGGSGGSGQTDEDGKVAKGGKPDDDDDVDPEVLKHRLKNKREEQARQFKELAEAKRERDELKAFKEEQERKAKTAEENMKADLEKDKKTIAALNETVRRLTVENAFANVKDIVWHDVNDALSFVDLSEVEFDEETGKVKDYKTLVDAAKNLAKAKPYLVKSKTSPEGGTPNGKKTGQVPPTQPITAGEDARLAKKYGIRV